MEQIFADWRSLMVGIQLWLEGANPYASYPHPVFPGRMVNAGWYAYPPPTLFLFTPLALLPWPLSSAILLLASIIPFERWTRQTSLRTGLPWLLLWLPLAQGLWIGQTTLLALVALLWGERAAHERQDVRAAFLLALALLKPQIGIVPIAWLLLEALWQRRWRLPLAFTLINLVLWGGTALLAGPQIYVQWLGGLMNYDQFLPNRPLLFPPFGMILGALAVFFWYRHGRGDMFGLALLFNTLIYPLSVVYSASALAMVVIRWNPRWPWYPLILSWLIPMLVPLAQRTPDSIAGMTQAIIATALLTALLPQLPGQQRK
ncbi:glycosyltransferase 87 family protein [Candidatus Oscillochloris fontis]|uniref:glycosyltransferase 87 family protein n=1 Tax=Candidatus Oscillochloris fontis TaxID=2496868 RepID=UPI00101C55F8|nr:glycosyltransferase 87 family protein [Candidatus Oscillochloris fontis]